MGGQVGIKRVSGEPCTSPAEGGGRGTVRQWQQQRQAMLHCHLRQMRLGRWGCVCVCVSRGGIEEAGGCWDAVGLVWRWWGNGIYFLCLTDLQIPAGYNTGETGCKSHHL